VFPNARQEKSKLERAEEPETHWHPMEPPLGWTIHFLPALAAHLSRHGEAPPGLCFRALQF